MAVLLTACAAPPPKPSPQAMAPGKGKYESQPANQGVIRIYLKADGTVIRAEGLKGGIWEKEAELSGEPTGLGSKLVDISVWDHDGSLNDLKINDGTTHGQSAHHHAGPTNPPWNTHCHKYIQIGTQWVVTHC